MSDNWQMGSLARQDDYDPFAAEKFVNPAVQGAIGGIAEQVKVPGQMMAPNPYPPGSEEADFYDASKTAGAADWAPGMALGMLGGSAAVAPGEMLLGAGVKPRMSSVLGDITVSRGPPRGMLTAEDFTPPAAAAPPQQVTMPNTYADPRLHAKAENIWGTYPQYAEQYPAVGPPSLMQKMPDPKRPGQFLSKAYKDEVPYDSMEEALAKDATPGYFLQKKLTPEAELFQKQRNIVQRDMDIHGYTPYFDPNQRADVDPSNYGPFPDTQTAADPRTAATQAKFNELYGTPEARARLQAGYEKGQTIPGSENWYYMKQLEDAYVAELGPQAGRDAFRKEFSGMMAATTGGASPYDNFLMSHYANFLNKQGEQVAMRAYQMPFPVGGRFASGNMKQAQNYIDRGMTPFNPVQNPKRSDFDTAYLGNKNAGTIDEQMFGAIVPGQTIPKWYGPATRTLHQEAGKVGVDARGFQDVGWAGLKAIKTEAETGKPFQYEGPMINQINRSIETTHRLTGMPRDEIVRRGLIRKEIPMYSIAGAAGIGAMGSLARQDQEEYQ